MIKCGRIWGCDRCVLRLFQDLDEVIRFVKHRTETQLGTKCEWLKKGRSTGLACRTDSFLPSPFYNSPFFEHDPGSTSGMSFVWVCTKEEMSRAGELHLVHLSDFTLPAFALEHLLHSNR